MDVRIEFQMSNRGEMGPGTRETPTEEIAESPPAAPDIPLWLGCFVYFAFSMIINGVREVLT
jgi:hypothetical protein